jgi:hypothetical protein
MDCSFVFLVVLLPNVGEVCTKQVQELVLGPDSSLPTTRTFLICLVILIDRRQSKALLASTTISQAEIEPYVWVTVKAAGNTAQCCLPTVFMIPNPKAYAVESLFAPFKGSPFQTSSR